MKYFIIFLFVISFIVFSCGGTPKSNTAASFPLQSEEIQNETFISSVPEYFEPLSLEKIPVEELTMSELLTENFCTTDILEEEIAEFDITDESDYTENIVVVLDAEPITEIASIEMAQNSAPSAIVPDAVQIQAETPFMSVPVLPPVQIQPVQSLPQPSSQMQTQPSLQITGPPLSLVPATVPEREKPVRTEPPRLDTARDEPVTPAQSVLIPQNEEVIFSRVVRATVGQTIEIPFRGTGWVYLGELASRRGVVYESRRLDPEGQSFIFRVEDTGTYALKFYKQDFIRDYILNDHVQVIAGESPVSGGADWFNPPIDRGRVAAARWPSALEEAEIQRGGSRPAIEVPPVDISQRGAASSQGTVTAQDSVPVQGAASAQGTQTMQPPAVSVLPQTAAPETASQSGVIEAPMPPDVILQRAKDAFDSGNVSAAIALLDQYNEHYQSGTDELYWLYGQFYEANSPSRNILLSLDYYRRLVREYPQSRRYNDARGRIAYLERYYINIH